MVVITPALLAGAGTALSGAGSIIGAFRGGGGGQTDYASLYAQQLAPGQSYLTIAGQELGALMAPYIGTLGLRGQLASQTSYDQFQQATSRDTTQAGLQAGLASQYASNVLGLQDAAAKSKMSMELLGGETASALARQYATNVGELQKTALAGETSLLDATTKAQAAAGLEASRRQNELAADISKTNLDIRKMQENTRNQLTLQRGQVEGQLALKRFGAGMALAGQRSFA